MPELAEVEFFKIESETWCKDQNKTSDVRDTTRLYGDKISCILYSIK